MKIVFLSPESVYPVNTGGRIVVYNKIKYLSKLGHEIILFCVVDSEEEIKVQKSEMKKYCHEMHFYNRNGQKLKKYINSVALPFAVGSRTIKNIEKDLELLITKHQIDIIWCEMPQMAANLKRIKIPKSIKCVLSQQNIEFLSMQSLARSFKSKIKRTVYTIDSQRFKFFEKSLYRRNIFDAFVFVSSEDKKYFEKHLNYNNKPLKIVPIGSDEHELSSLVEDGNCIIVGKMSYPPNVEGVLWFVHKIWNSIKKEYPKAHLYIVGKDPDKKIIDIIDDSITVTGTVDSVEPYYRKASVAVIPVFSGGGVKTKLIEATSYNVPIVSTSFGIEGTDFNESHISLCDTESSFISEVLSALRHDKNSLDRSKRANELFRKKYTWSGICEDLSLFLLNLK